MTLARLLTLESLDSKLASGYMPILVTGTGFAMLEASQQPLSARTLVILAHKRSA
jgi:hypothetical protein